MTGQSECAGELRGQRRGTITNRHDPVDRRRRARLPHRVDRTRLLMKAHGNRLVPPRILELVAAVARKHEANAERSCRVSERSNLIAGGRRDEKNPLHTISIGSAQQYQGSLTYGTGTPALARRGAAGSSACSRANAAIPANAWARGIAAAAPTKRMTAACSASTRGSGWRHGHVSDAASNGATTRRMSSSSSSGDPAVTSRRIAS